MRLCIHFCCKTYKWYQCVSVGRVLYVGCNTSAFRHRGHYVFGLSVRPSEARNTLFPPAHVPVGPSYQPWPFCGMSVRPSGEVSGHLPENAWRECPEILYADVSWPTKNNLSYTFGRWRCKVHALSKKPSLWSLKWNDYLIIFISTKCA